MCRSGAAGYDVKWVRRSDAGEAHPDRRILVAFLAGELDPVVLEASLRIARADDATLVPAYLIIVPLQYPFDSPLADEVGTALPLLEAVEQAAARANVPVDARLERGRSVRDALTRLWTAERFDRIVLPASGNGHRGFQDRDLAWVLGHSPTETLVLKPGPPA
jgi:nucleotide-binding universal stress UspA family protein